MNFDKIKKLIQEVEKSNKDYQKLFFQRLKEISEYELHHIQTGLNKWCNNESKSFKEIK